MEQQIQNLTTQMAEMTGYVQTLRTQLDEATAEVQRLRAQEPRPGNDRPHQERILVDSKGFQNLKNYDSDPKTWATWEFKFLNFIESLHPRIRELTEWAVSQEEGITDIGARDAIRIEPGAESIQRQLYLALAQLMEGEALGIIRNCSRSPFKGLEAWRRLIRRFDPHSIGRQRNILSKVLHPGQSKMPDLSRAIERWIADVQRYEERSGKRLDEDIRASVIIEMTPNPLQQHLILNQSRLGTYANILTEISAYLEHRFESEAVNNDNGPSPMDVGSLVPKGGKKGKGGKGGKKGSNAEQCTKCWKWGHQAKDCRAGKGNPQSQWDADQKKKTECYACGKMGHMAYECRSKGGKGAGKSSGKGKGGKPGGKKGKGHGKGVNSVEQEQYTWEQWNQWAGQSGWESGHAPPAQESAAPTPAGQGPQGAREVTSLELCGLELPPSRVIQPRCIMCTMTTEAATTPIDITTTLLPSGKTAVPADAEAPTEAELQARHEPHQAPRQEAHHHQAEAMEARIPPPPYRFCERNYPPYDSERVYSPYHEVYHMERSVPPNHHAQRELMSVNNMDVYDEIEASVDSGAGVTIMPSEMCTHIPIRETADSRAGTTYRAASGHPVPDMGSRTFDAQTSRSQSRRLTCKVGPVRKMLLSVNDMLSKGNRVIFDPQGSYVENITTGDWTPIEQKNGIFLMKLWVKRNPQNRASSGNPPAAPQIELSTLPRALSYQPALPQIPEGAIIKTADLQNFYRLASQL